VGFCEHNINPRIPVIKEVYLLYDWLLTPKEGFCSVELVIVSDHIVTECLKAEQGSHFLGNGQKRFHCNDQENSYSRSKKQLFA
jgi:hypothetical protein